MTLIDETIDLLECTTVAELREAVTHLRVRNESPHIQSLAQQILEAHTLDRARHYTHRLLAALRTVKTSGINAINLARWKDYEDIATDSLWIIPKRDRQGEHNAKYWGNFIPQIPNQMIRRYTKPGDWVLDTFAGSGTTLIEARRLQRNAIGIELLPAVVDMARENIAKTPGDTVAEVFVDTCTIVDYPQVLAEHDQTSVQLVIMHPPYFNIIRFSDEPGDLSALDSLPLFLNGMKLAIQNAVSVLDAKRYLVIVMGDAYKNGEWIPLGNYVMQAALDQGLTLKSIVVKNYEETTGKRGQKGLWRYRALAGGFYVFKHEYIYVFRKP
jgi:DNA modification methylase